MAVDAERVHKELTEVMNSVWFEGGTRFLEDFANGKVPKDKLARFAPSYCFQVDNFKRCVAAIYSQAEPRDVRELMLENLEEEHGEGDPNRDHAVLVQRFGRALGADLPTPYDLEPIPESRQWIDRILAICQKEHFVVGLAALSYGIEARTRVMSFLGALYHEKYGLAKEDLEFFFMHLEADEEHAGRAIELIAKYCTTEELLERSKWAVGEVLDATRVVAEGMERICSE